MTNKKQPKHRGVANPELAAAMRELRRSSAASPQETRGKRLRTRETILRNELRQAD